MIPSLVARSVEAGVTSYVANDFKISSKTFNQGSSSILEAFLKEPENLVKGPWSEISLPFRKASKDVSLPFKKFDVAKIIPGFQPYEHQLQAFQKLAKPDPESILVATGTGSGKTEAFLFPIIDYCLSTPGKGLKALLIYPMNALASDQEKRLAKLLDDCVSKLGSRKVSAGLYTGDTTEPHKDQTSEHLVRDRNQLRNNPPEILITNYKMLDLMLMRPEDQKIWDNAKEFKYLVVDELHTYDGAQGTDLACLIRRIRARLGLAENQFACVGTSATMGDNLDELCSYAQKIFSVPFIHLDATGTSTSNSVIQESRQTAEEYLETLSQIPLINEFPTPKEVEKWPTGNQASYIRAVVKSWFGPARELMEVAPLLSDTTADSELTIEEKSNLAKALPYLEAFQMLVQDMKGVVSINELAQKWLATVPNLKLLTSSKENRKEQEMEEDQSTSSVEKIKYVETLIDSLLALVSAARKNVTAERPQGEPFLNVRSQLWVRELSRMVATVDSQPQLVAYADHNPKSSLALPIVRCRDCWNTAWAGIVTEPLRSRKATVHEDLREFYKAWFSGPSTFVRLFYPIANKDEFDEMFPKGRKTAFSLGDVYQICPQCRRIKAIESADGEQIFSPENTCSCGNHDLVTVWSPPSVGAEEKGLTIASNNRCPYCNSENQLHIFGASSTSLSAAATDKVFSTPFIEERDKKIIGFSDSVQDAAHKAGFLQARNYRPVIRNAISQWLVENSQNLQEDSRDNSKVSFLELLKKVPEYWLGKFRESIKAKVQDSLTEEQISTLADCAFLSVFIPPEHQTRPAWEILGNALQKAAGTPEKDDWAIRYKDVFKAYGYEQRKLFRHVWERTIWEIFMEFGRLSEFGKSVQRMEIASLLLPQQQIEFVSQKIKEILEQKFQQDVPLNIIQHFLIGLLEKMRNSGSISPWGFSDIGAQGLENAYGDFLKTGNLYQFVRKPEIRYYGTRYQPPVGLNLTRVGNDKFFQAISLKTGESWYEDWFKRVLVNNPNKQFDLTSWDKKNIDDFYKTVLEILSEPVLTKVEENTEGETSEDKLLVKYERSSSGREPGYVLNTRALKVTPDTTQWKCTECGRRFVAALENAKSLDQMPCLNKRCIGTLVLEKENQAELKDQSISQAPFRIIAREHTALINGEEREEAEKSFSRSSDPWSVNFLSATSTLEMGIDVGTLSTVMQFKMPPGVSNHLQRIGRAGRRDGNSLALTFASRDAHCQYFWTDPDKMLSADVDVPGVFLRAVSVLERQMLAYAISLWVSEQKIGRKFPERLEEIVDGSGIKKTEKAKTFPDAFLAWTKTNANRLWEGFSSLFAPQGGVETIEELLDSSFNLANSLEKTEADLNIKDTVVKLNGKEVKEEQDFDHIKSLLREYVEGTANAPSKMEKALLSAFMDASAIIRRRDEARTNLTARINKLKKKEGTALWDEASKAELKSMQNQLESEKEILKDFKAKNFFGYLTDVGLLPNYAFPEEGVLVNSVIVRHQDEDDDSRVKSRQLSFTRGAEQALKDVSPGSVFYFNGHKFKIDQLALESGQKDEEWRLCSECSYSEKVDANSPSANAINCPNCGSPQWGGVERKRRMLRMREVIAHADARQDQITDSSEQRTIDIQNREVLVFGDKDAVQGAWKIADEKYPFGFEFLKSATVREINFGRPDSSALAETFKVAGKEVQKTGFTVCRECGMLKKGPHEKGNRHDFTCKYRGVEDDSDAWIEGLFLYRELHSEAIRIRVPVSEEISGTEADVGTQSLLAAIRLGLKKYFGGSVDHLRIALQSEPDKEDRAYRHHYIVIYDSIPGGSGYLKDLMRFDIGKSDRELEQEKLNPTSIKPAGMVQVLKSAYDAVSNCTCASDSNSDGCYKCVYQYRNAYMRDKVSRSRAEKILSRICTALSKEDGIEKIPTISSLPTSTESELEDQFVKKLAACDPDNIEVVSVPSDQDRSRMAYDIHVKLTEKAQRNWTRVIGRSPGERFTWHMEAQPKLDFKRSARKSRPDFSIRPSNPSILNIYPRLLSDIFLDGWKYHFNSLDVDTEKRQELRNTNSWVWSLTWKDVVKQNRENDTKSESAPNFMKELVSKPPQRSKATEKPYRFTEILEAELKQRNQLHEEPKEIVRPLEEKVMCFYEKYVLKYPNPLVWFIDWLKDPIGFEETMRIGMEYSMQNLSQSTSSLPNCPLPLKPRDSTEKSIFFHKYFPPGLTVVAKLTRIGQKSLSISAAEVVNEAPYFEESAKANNQLKEQWTRFWVYANALQFLRDVYICTTENQDKSCFIPEMQEKAEGEVKTDALSQWRKEQKSLSVEPFYDNLIEAIDEIALADIPYTDEIGAEGIAEEETEVFSKPTGLRWEFGKRPIYLFMEKDLISEPPTSNSAQIIIARKGTDWVNELAAAFGKGK